MDYRYPPGAVRRLDDALLWAYGDAYIELRGNALRGAALRARLEKMRGGELGTPPSRIDPRQVRPDVR